MAREWWDAQLSGASPNNVFCWTVLGAFIRIGTNPRVFEYPLSLDQALSRVCKAGWINPARASFIPTDRHWIIFRKMLVEGQAVANLVTDAHFGRSGSSEHGCELISTDTDFSRFPGIKWKNPLK